MVSSSPLQLAPPPWGSGVAFITGAGGFIGGRACAAFQQAGWTVAAFGPRPAAGAEIAGPACWIEGRVAGAGLQQALAAVGQPEAIVHAAGSSSVGQSFVDPAADFDRTVGSVREVLEFMRRSATKSRLIFLSSAAVYGSGHAGAILETARPDPISPYGLHKGLAEQLIAGWAERFELQACCIRLFSVYGPGIRKQLLWDVAGRLRARPAELRLSGTGQESRDYLYVDDAVRLIGCAIQAQADALPKVINGGAGVPVAVAEIAASLCQAAGLDPELVFDGQIRAGDPRSLVADVSRAAQLGFQAQVGLHQGVARFYAWAAAAE